MCVVRWWCSWAVASRSPRVWGGSFGLVLWRGEDLGALGSHQFGGWGVLKLGVLGWCVSPPSFPTSHSGVAWGVWCRGPGRWPFLQAAVVWAFLLGWLPGGRPYWYQFLWAASILGCYGGHFECCLVPRGHLGVVVVTKGLFSGQFGTVAILDGGISAAVHPVAILSVAARGGHFVL